MDQLIDEFGTNDYYCPHCKSKMEIKMLLVAQWTGRKYKLYYQNYLICSKCQYMIPEFIVNEKSLIDLEALKCSL